MRKSRLRAYGFALAATAVIVVATALALMRPVAPDPRNAPRAGLRRRRSRAAGHVLNDYRFGGYLIFAGIPTFIDGRGELYGGRFIARYNRDLALADLTDFLKLLDEYRIDATLLAPDTPAVKLLDRLPDWRRVYADGVAVVHKRRTPAPR